MMSELSTAEYVNGYDARDVQIEDTGRKFMDVLKAIPWTRVAVDVMLIAAILLVSSNFLSVR